MSASGPDAAIVRALAEEFLQRHRRGQRPALKEYTDRHPELADQIRAVFPAMARMDNMTLADEFPLGGQTLEASGTSAAADPGALLRQLGDYRILREVGRGGMGIVYEAEQVSLGRHVALKVLPQHVLLDVPRRRRFEREAKAAARLHHTNIVPVFGVGEHDGVPYYVMQFIEGLGLDEVLGELRRLGPATAGIEVPAEGQRRAAHQGLSAAEVARTLVTGEFHGAADPTRELPVDNAEPQAAAGNVARVSQVARIPAGCSPSGSSVVLPGGPGDGQQSGGRKPTYWTSVANIGVQVAEALAHAHGQGILHRDIKPSNLLLDTRGTVWVTDFGLAKGEDLEDLTHTGDFLGTLRYMPPEAFEGNSDPRSDIYSLGLTLYELLALRPAFEEKDRHRLVKRVTTEEPERLDRLSPQVPRDLVTIVHKAIDRDSGRRYASAAELAADLQCFLADEPIRARRVSAVERLLRWSRRHKGMAAALSAVALLLVLLAAGALLAAAHFRQQEHEQRRLADEKDKERGRAEQARTLAEEARQRESDLRALAQAQAQELRRNLYFAEMNLAGQAADAPGGVWRVMELLAKWQRIQPDLRGWEWYYLHGLGHRDLLTLRGHADNVRTVAWNRDGTRLASAGADQAVKVWDAATGENVLTLHGHTGGVTSLAWSPDGTRLASADEDRTVRIWDAASRKNVHTLRGHTGGVTSVAWSPDGTRLASAGEDRTVRVWDLATAEAALTLRGHANPVLSVAWSPDGARLASAGEDRTVRVWDVATRKNTLTLRGHDWTVSSVAWSPDGTRLASASGDATVKLWEAATGKELRTLRGHASGVTSVAWNPDGRRLASASGDATVQVWDVATGKAIFALGGHAGGVNAVAWRPDGTRLASAGDDRTVKIWPATARTESLATRAHTAGVQSVAWSPDGARLASACWDGTVTLWQAATGKENRTLRGHGSTVQSVAWSPDGTRLASAGDDQTVRVWDTATGKETLTLRGHAGNVASVAWAPDGRRLASAGDDRTVRVWDASTGKEARTLSGHTDRVTSVAWGPGGTRLASAGDDQTVRIWDTASGKATRTLRGHSEGVEWVAWGPDGTRLASAGDDRTLRVWDVATGRETLTLRGHTNPVLSVAWSPDGTRLASAGQDRTVKVWDAATGKETFTFRGHTDRVLSVAWSPDGVGLASASADQTVRVHDATVGYVLERSPRLLPSLERRLADDPKRISDWQLRADIHARLGEWDRAAADIRQYLALRRDHPPWYATDWWVVGPYPDDLKASDPPQHDLNPAQPVAGAAVPPGYTPTRLPWQVVPRDANGFVDFGALFERAEHISAYALTRVYCPEKQPVMILVGADDGLRLWLNGRLLHDNPASGIAVSDHDAVPATLEAGWNTLLTKVVNRTGEPALSLRLTCPPAEPAAESVEALMERGSRLERRREWRQAIGEYSRALALKPDFAEAYRHRGRCYAELARPDQAAADFAQALARTPQPRDPWWPESPGLADELAQRDDLFARVVRLRPNDRRLGIARVQQLARRARWREAEAALARVIELDPSDHVAWHHQAVLLLELGDAKRYRQACREMLARFGRTRDPNVAERTAKTCLLVPHALTDLRPALELADLAVTGTQKHADYRWFLLVKGMAEYRSGRFADAIVRLRKTVAEGGDALYCDALARLFLAMAQQRLGQADEARKTLDKARARIERTFPKPDGEGLDEAWSDWLRCRIVLREAQELIDGQPRPVRARSPQ
jgi:WD40 repeat protein/serine/threonine protein kinase/tetratricopeptide (TPR) repeat protein